MLDDSHEDRRKPHFANPGQKEHETLLPELQFVTLAFNQALYTVHAEIEYGYFMNTGLISCPTVMPVLRLVLSATRDLSDQSPILVKVQITGQALRIKAASLHKLLTRLPMLERLLSRFADLQALESQQIAAW